MEVKAKLNYLRIAPRKVRLVADLIRGKTVEQAQNILKFTVKKGADPVAGLLKSVTSSAVNNFHLVESNLYISKIAVDEGPKLKRWRARARGSAFEIQKKTSHIVIILDEKEKGMKKESAKKKKTSEKIESVEKKESKNKPTVLRKEIQKPKVAMGAKKSFIRRKAI